jgi:hypothetical protein
MKKLPHQTRDNIDPAAVLDAMRRGETPAQSWAAIAEAACHRIARLEEALRAIEATAGHVAAHARKSLER